MTRIFISYRRDDSQAMTDRLYDALAAEFQSENVIQDVFSVPVGEDLRLFFQSEINRCDVVLVVIGPAWLTIPDESGNRRLDSASDWVRVEIETTLALNKRLVPILVGNTAMPKEHELPKSLRDLVFRNAARLRYNPDFRGDAKKIISDISGFILENNRPSLDVEKLFTIPMEWCSISEGSADFTNSHQEVQPFEIAKYPVTFSQFQSFVEADDGYMYPRWWDYSAAAVAWHEQNPTPLDPFLKKALHPREMVSWFEAVAFCLWLGHKTNRTILLPTDVQRRRASQGNDMRVYPWGNDFQSSYCNTRENLIKRTTPVTKYHSGASPFGVMDLSGNVWEWSVSTQNAIDLVSTQRQVYGGGWRGRHRHARIDFVRFHDPSYRSCDLGFRCVRL